MQLNWKMQSIRVLLVDKSKVKTKHTQSQVPSQSKVAQLTLRCWAKTQYISLSKTLLFCTDDTTFDSRNGFEFHSKCGSTFSIVYYLFNHVLFSPCFFSMSPLFCSRILFRSFTRIDSYVTMSIVHFSLQFPLKRENTSIQFDCK